MQWFADGVRVTLRKERGVTSNLQVFVDGSLVHSRLRDGCLDESAERQDALRCAIVTALST